ncbi:MAG: outer membrane beta-barrel protein [Alphaproteobacteria bacterium]
MMIVRKLAAIACVLAVSLILLAPLPASAVHDPAPAPEPVPGSAPASAPVSVERPAWSNGAYFTMEVNFGDAVNPSTDADFEVDLDWSAGLGMSGGYRLGPVRLEGEIATTWYRVGSLDLGAGAPFAKADYSGGVSAERLMANVYLEYPSATNVRPYLGAGYGVARVFAAYNESVCYIFCFSTKNEVVDDWTQVSAWQFMVGASFRNEQEASEWFIGYRYFGTEDLDFRAIGGPAFIQDGLQSHSLNIGIRFLL